MRLILLPLLVILASPLASGEGSFILEWTDVFPMCAMNSGDYNLARCACEFFIPNLHLGFMYSMFSNMITSFFLIDGVYDFIIDFYSDPVGAVSGIVGNFVDTVIDFFTVSTDDRSSIEILSGLMNGVINWVYSVITPFLVLIFLLFYEFIKTYLILGIAFNLWTFVLKELHLMGDASPAWSLYLVAITIILIFVGTIWLLGSDLGLYSSLIII